MGFRVGKVVVGEIDGKFVGFRVGKFGPQVTNQNLFTFGFI